MAEIDFTPYVDLKIFDKTTTSIYDDAVEYAKVAFPEFTPRPGTAENAILESVSAMTELMVSSVNRLPNSLMEGILDLMGFQKIAATASEATVEFTVTINTGVTIASGTVVSYDVFNEDGVLVQYLYETTEDLEISSGNTTGVVTVRAVDPSKYPDIPLNSDLTLISTSPYILSVTLASLESVGQDAEIDADYFARGVRFLASLNQSLVTASQMTNYIATTYPTVSRFKVYDLTDSADMLFATADDSLNVTVALCDSNGDAIDASQKTIIEDDLTSRTVAGLTVHLYDMHTFDVDVVVEVVAESNYSTATVSTAVSAAIESYLSVSGWNWLESIDTRYLTALISRVPGVKYVDTVTLSLSGSPTEAEMDGDNVSILEKGAIPIGSCTTTAT